ncbi:probable arginine--tRNA ligase, mitochondrial [Sabethes cyaneus]|uniref:probable arginine--tRNA ligase, mitochondrial n=1 Tax=Sabethes cyaneus TaxID=53552 RepID=UPI00237E8C5E|nr:probable arginine--tRNA ligase, mitochondrial [Sabethes cyaneus]
MTHSYRNLILNALIPVIGKQINSTRLTYGITQIFPEPAVHLTVPSGMLQSRPDITSTVSNLFDKEPRIKKVHVINEGRTPKVLLQLDRDYFVRSVIDNDNSKKVQKAPDAPKTVLEFSSPNIAKPFHAGHLRSAIIGNFLSNLYDHIGHNVVKINYLGDWGTQFGYLKLGVELKNLTKEYIKLNPIKKLYEAYVHAYKAASDNDSLQMRAREIFAGLENGQFEELQAWNEIRSYAVDELKNVYNRLGITFDHYHWESQYGISMITEVLSLLEKNGVAHPQVDGRKTVQVGNRMVPIVKSDGTTLYLTRDVAALIDRHKRFEFDNVLYVVDNAQSDHFAALISIAQQLNLPYAANVAHIKFGRVKGMSTRKGTVVFLADILDEAEILMRRKQLAAKTTKIDLSNDDETTSILATTAVVINDLKQRRMRDYDFSWDKALQTDGDSGIKLQYTHCRLWSLENSFGSPDEKCNPDLLPEKEALALVCEIARFEEALAEAEEKKEACVLVNYLFSLCNAINRALLTLNVKNEECNRRQTQRMLLFTSARKTLHRGMEILGLRPLQKM